MCVTLHSLVGNHIIQLDVYEMLDINSCKEWAWERNPPTIHSFVWNTVLLKDHVDPMKSNKCNGIGDIKLFWNYTLFEFGISSCRAFIFSLIRSLLRCKTGNQHISFSKEHILSLSKFWHLNGTPSKHKHRVEAYSFREVVDFSSPTSLCSASPPWRRLLLQVHWLFFTLLLYNITLAEKLQVRTVTLRAKSS